MHFHAKWRAQFDVPTRPMIDWNYLTAKGQGVFAGVAFAIDNPVKDWWGEGDEKIYVDGETFPSHFGTGTEDYYGYAWCWPGLFTHAYHAQPRCDGPGNYGRTSVNRFHILDCSGRRSTAIVPAIAEDAEPGAHPRPARSFVGAPGPGRKAAAWRQAADDAAVRTRRAGAALQSRTPTRICSTAPMSMR